MKKICTPLKMVYTLLGVGVIAMSCQKDHNIYDPNKVRNTSDLEVPANFNWTMTKSVSLAISSPTETALSIFTDKECSENALIARMPVSQTAKEISLEIPVVNENLYIKYPVENGKFKILATQLPAAGTKADVSVVLPEDTEATGGHDLYEKHLLVFTNRGTVMFEDNWPQTGDYDFNDFVVQYCIQTTIYEPNEEDQKNGKDEELFKREGVNIILYFQAIGGEYPYRLGLQFDSLKIGDVTDPGIIKQNCMDGLTARLVSENAEDPLAFVIEGTENLKDKTGGTYFNTEKEYQLGASQRLASISITIPLKTGYNNLEKQSILKNCAIQYNQNFFLQHTDNGGKEIHLRGYQPTVAYKNYENDRGNAVYPNPAVTYCNEKGLVWGIKVPNRIFHSIEKQDIKEAYPDFINWVSSGGKESRGWYNNYTPGKVITSIGEEHILQ